MRINRNESPISLTQCTPIYERHFHLVSKDMNMNQMLPQQDGENVLTITSVDHSPESTNIDKNV